MSKKEKNEGMDRREFIKGAAIAGGALTLSALMTGTSEAKAAASQKWTSEADVLILGFGGAGACAAIEAHDAGAKVLIIEKQPQKTHYPNTRMSGGIFHSPDPAGDPAALKSYAKAMFSGENLPWKLEGEQPDVSDGLAQAWAETSPQNLAFLKKQDPEFGGVPMSRFSGAAFPNFPGAKESKYQVFGSSYTDRASFDIPTKDAPKSQKMNGEAFFTALRGGVEQRGIKVMYETAARQLVTNDKGEVIGAVAEQKGGKKISLKARKAVIITTGGYEYNKEMRRAFLEGPGVEGWAFYGTPENTGDGIEMAMKVGAQLAKVGKAASRIITAVPIRHNGLKMGLITDSVGGPRSIVVDNMGNRYAAETLVTTDPSRYFFYKEALKFDITKLLYPRCPSWMIFDETFRSKITITSLGISTAGFGFVPWTKDNMDAINRGWILKGNTIEEVAAKIKAHSDNRKLMDPASLAKTVDKYNEACKKGKDEEFDRKPASLGPIDTPPYYALPLYAGGPNTKGGIAANARREVLDWKNSPIPRLYTAGEISSALKFVYQGGGNLTECIVFGRIAGKNAAALKPWK
jgi:succinate dehydrogenase/fumarate reductase flavoprotein subunit